MNARLTIIGLGKLGLPLSAFYASRGAIVRGVDRDPERVRSINERTTIDLDNEEGLRAKIESLKPGQFTASTDVSAAVAESNYVIVVVPVIARARGAIDFTAMEAACDTIAAGLKPGTTIMFETTLPVGTTRNRLTPRLERSGLKVGKDFFVAFSPERVLVNRIFTDLEKYPKIVGGVDAESGARAAEFYEAHLTAPVWQVKNAETSEFTKLAETCYRTTSIALANELAMAADKTGVDVYEVIRGANSQPYSSILEPGIGVGGHCLPVYPFLMEASNVDTPLIERGRAINASMGEYAVKRIENAGCFRFEFFDTVFGELHALAALEREWLRHDGDGQRTRFACEFRNDAGCARARAATHAGGDEHQIRAVENHREIFARFFGCFAADVRVRTRTEAAREARADLHGVVRLRVTERLDVGVDRVEFDTG